jgi:nitroreductase
MPLLPLSTDELLSTTRAVRKRLDLGRPVEREVLEECLRLAQQAPSASNLQRWSFVVVTDQQTRSALGELYRRGGEQYRTSPTSNRRASFDDPARQAVQQRVASSADYLIDHIHEVPVHVIPCVSPRTDGLPGPAQSGAWGTIAPATWSFMLAARARGLGTAWTTFHLAHEREAADLLGIPYDRVMQIALVPVAYTLGTEFKPAPREPLGTMVHWERW